MGKGATVELYLNNEKVGEGRLEATVPARFGIDTFGIGADTGSPVTEDYSSNEFEGRIEGVTIELQPQD